MAAPSDRTEPDRWNGSAEGRTREEALAAVLAVARDMLGQSANAHHAEVTACLGEPLCRRHDGAAADGPAECLRCERLVLSQDGAVSYPNSGRA